MSLISQNMPEKSGVSKLLSSSGHPVCYLDLPLFVVDACQVSVDDGVVGAEVQGAQVRRHGSVRINMQTSVTSCNSFDLALVNHNE